MTNEKYDDLLVEMRAARDMAAKYRKIADEWDKRLGELITILSYEDRRIAEEALASMHSASRKLVVGE